MGEKLKKDQVGEKWKKRLEKNEMEKNEIDVEEGVEGGSENKIKTIEKSK